MAPAGCRGDGGQCPGSHLPFLLHPLWPCSGGPDLSLQPGEAQCLSVALPHSLSPSLTPSHLPSLPLTFHHSLSPSITPSHLPSLPLTFHHSLSPSITPSHLPSLHQVFELIHKWAGLFLTLGFISAIATMIKVAAFSLAGEKLTYRLRSQSLARILRRSMRWFDDSAHSPSALATVLASDTPLLQGVSV